MINKNAQLVYVAPRLAALAYGACAILLPKKQCLVSYRPLDAERCRGHFPNR